MAAKTKAKKKPQSLRGALGKKTVEIEIGGKKRKLRPLSARDIVEIEEGEDQSFLEFFSNITMRKGLKLVWMGLRKEGLSPTFILQRKWNCTFDEFCESLSADLVEINRLATEVMRMNGWWTDEDEETSKKTDGDDAGESTGGGS